VPSLHGVEDVDSMVKPSRFVGKKWFAKQFPRKKTETRCPLNQPIDMIDDDLRFLVMLRVLMIYW
jgi:hypothetical protein